MNQQAQNALLKTIEEPPAYAVILLLTTNADSFLPTILSRCITLNLKVVKEDVIKSYLMKTYHIPDYQADVCAAFSQGNVGSHSAGIFRRIWGTESIGAAADEASGRY